MSVEHLFHYDPFISANLFHNAILLRYFAKVWAIIKGNISKSCGWKATLSKSSWVWLDGPQQQSNWVCGFYVMKFIQKFCDYMAKDLESSIEVCAFKPLSAIFSLSMCKFFPNALNTNLCHYTCFAADDP